MQSWRVNQYKAHNFILSLFSQIKSEDGQPLSGVLLSLSGTNFRSNLLTQDTGLLTFNNLVPNQNFFFFNLFIPVLSNISLVKLIVC